MPESTPGITIRLYSASGDTVAGDAAVAVELTCDDGSAYRGAFTPPYPPETWPAILRALEPGLTSREPATPPARPCDPSAT